MSMSSKNKQSKINVQKQMKIIKLIILKKFVVYNILNSKATYFKKF